MDGASGVDQAEDDCVGANPQSQRKRGDDGEARPLNQHAQAILQVLPEGFHV